MSTVTAVRRALEETARELGQNDVLCPAKAGIKTLLDSRYGATILANRLSDRGDAGNFAVKANLGDIQNVIDNMSPTDPRKPALEWAIDQLTPPKLALPPPCPVCKVDGPCQCGGKL